MSFAVKIIVGENIPKKENKLSDGKHDFNLIC